jgi:hypothetical protein
MFSRVFMHLGTFERILEQVQTLDYVENTENILYFLILSIYKINLNILLTGTILVPRLFSFPFSREKKTLVWAGHKAPRGGVGDFFHLFKKSYDSPQSFLFLHPPLPPPISFQYIKNV